MSWGSSVAGSSSGGSTFSINDQATTTSITGTSDGSVKVYTNTGASADITLTLPTAAADNDPIEFFVTDSDGGITITAAAGDNIQFGGLTTATAGNIYSNFVGDSIMLHCKDATTWVATRSRGNWLLDGYRNNKAISIDETEFSTLTVSADPFLSNNKGCVAAWVNADILQSTTTIPIFGRATSSSAGVDVGFDTNSSLLRMRTQVFGTGTPGNRAWWSKEMKYSFGDGQIHLFVWNVDTSDIATGAVGLCELFMDGRRLREVDPPVNTGTAYATRTDYQLFGNLRAICLSMGVWEGINLTHAEVDAIWNEGRPNNFAGVQGSALLINWWMGDNASDSDTATTGTIIDNTSNGNDATNNGNWDGNEIIDYPIRGAV